MLPTEKTTRRDTMNDLIILLYGPSKIGKSTWCSEMKNAVFLATEPGLNSLEVYQTPINSWDKLLYTCGDLLKGDHGFETVILDTIDNAYKLCAEYICDKNNIVHESDMDWGKGYALINNEFHRVLIKLASLPYGLVLISHSQEKDVVISTIGKITKRVPTLPDKIGKIVTSLVDIILFCDIDTTTAEDGTVLYNRVLRTKPNLYYDAGDRTGKLSKTLPLDFSAFIKEISGVPQL